MADKRASELQGGFSLVELMVGMVLGLMLIAGAASIYLATKRSYTEVEHVAALTENARFAEQIVGDSLRQLGFLGEVTANKVEVAQVLDSNPPADDCDDPAKAYDFKRLGYAATLDANGDALGCIEDGAEDPDGIRSDVLVIKRVVPRPFSAGPRVRDPNDPPGTTIDTPGPLENGRVYVMTNNVSGMLFDGASPPSISIGGEIPGGTAWEYQYEIFYIRQLSDDPKVPRMLSRRVLTYNTATSEMEFPDEPENLAEGVESMQLLFGYDSDSDGDVDTYKNPETIEANGNWEGVESVEVFMLVRSAVEDVQYTDEKTYTLGDVEILPKRDHFRRIISHTSVSLRNLKLMIRGGA